MSNTVLIVGAGPAGLSLAISLRRAGVDVRLIDKATVPPDDRSRATILQPRTLEVFDDLGVVDDAIAAGLVVGHVNFFTPSGRRGSVPFGARFLDSPYAQIVALPQDQTERVLTDHLVAMGGVVERGVELVAYSENAYGVQASFRHADGRTETAEARWIVGCDGARSTVRQLAGLDFAGITYADDGLIGDVVLDSNFPRGELSLCPQKRGFLLAFPLPGEGHFRIIMIVPSNDAADDRHLGVDEFREQLARMVPAGLGSNGGPPRIERVLWLTRYRLHRRGVSTYRKGRAFLAGDAAHIHSPVGAQGMNTAIQDGYNLGWKLALVATGDAPEILLDSYTSERHRIGEILLQGTDRAFAVAAGRGWLSTSIRSVMPTFAVRLLGLPCLDRRLTHFVSQLGVRYRQSPLSVEGPSAARLGSSAPHAGDRAPDATVLDVATGPRRLFDIFRGARHTLLVFGGSAPVDLTGFDALENRYAGLVNVATISATSTAAGHTVVDASGAAHRKYGAERGALYLIRPDGYVAFRGTLDDRAALERDLAQRFRREASAPTSAIAADAAPAS